MRALEKKAANESRKGKVKKGVREEDKEDMLTHILKPTSDKK